MNKMASFLDSIFIHEENSKSIHNKFNQLHSYIQQTIELEKTVNHLSANQQIINIAEYVSLYEKITKIIIFFAKSKLKERDDYIKNMKLLMIKGFRIFEDTFYNILKRYNSTDNENEKKNSLHKLRNLAECMSDPTFDYQFTAKLVSERSESILLNLHNKKTSLSKKLNFNSEISDKNTSLPSQLMSELLIYIKEEKNYIFSILESCSNSIKVSVFSLIIEKPIQFIINLINEIPNKQISLGNFLNFIDFLNLWQAEGRTSFKLYIYSFSKDKYNDMLNCIQSTEKTCKDYLKTFTDQIELFNEKLENENILPLTNRILAFISKLVKFDDIYETEESILPQRTYEFINNYLKLLEHKSSVFEKTYSPLRWIFLINNTFFIYSKISSNDFLKDKYNAYNINSDNSHERLKDKIGEYIDHYINSCWGKNIDEMKNLKFETKEDKKTLKSIVKENIKKVFSSFNETASKHIKIQKQLKIVETSIEKVILEKSIDYLLGEYEKFNSEYNNYKALSEDNKINDKYIVYSSKDLEQEIRLFFSSHILLKK